MVRVKVFLGGSLMTSTERRETGQRAAKQEVSFCPYLGTITVSFQPVSEYFVYLPSAHSYEIVRFSCSHLTMIF